MDSFPQKEFLGTDKYLNELPNFYDHFDDKEYLECGGWQNRPN